MKVAFIKVALVLLYILLALGMSLLFATLAIMAKDVFIGVVLAIFILGSTAFLFDMFFGRKNGIIRLLDKIKSEQTTK